MRKIDHFTNQYPLSKTLCFKLIPVGQTEEYFILRNLLEADEELAQKAEIVKSLIDRYHKRFIEHALTGFSFSDLNAYTQLYYKSNRLPKEQDELSKIAKKMRKEVADCFSKDSQYKGLFKADMIQKYLPEQDDLSEEETSAVEHFYHFTTYFDAFHENRKNMYTCEGKATEIAFRVVDQNLPKFLDNCKIGKLILTMLPREQLDELENQLLSILHLNPRDLFEASFFNHALTQSGIDTYNQAIGGFSTSDSRKIKGINEYVNEYRQKTGQRLPKLKPLFKQILSDRSSLSFIPEKIQSDSILLEAVNGFYTAISPDSGYSVSDVIEKITSLLSSIPQYEEGVYVPNGTAVTTLSQGAFSSWYAIQGSLNQDYDTKNRTQKIKDEEKYRSKRDAYFKKINSFSVSELERKTGSTGKLHTYILEQSAKLRDAVVQSFDALHFLLSAPYPSDRKLMTDEHSVELLKNFLDAVKDFQRFAGLFLGSGQEESKSELFYGEFAPLYEQLDAITPLYNKVRNYLTQKPYSKDKIKLNFDNPSLASGWSFTKEQDNSAVLFRKDGLYYLGVIDKSDKNAKKSFTAAMEQTPTDEADVFEKMYYYQASQPGKTTLTLMFNDQGKIQMKKGTTDGSGNNPKLDEERQKCLPPEIYRILKTESYKPHNPFFRKKDLEQFIDYYQRCTSAYYANKLDFRFKKPSEYQSFDEFTADVSRQGFQISFRPVSKAGVDQLVRDGKLYLFQIYNKDFSPYSKGTPNLHTLYFKTLFSEENLANITYALNGGAELFYRKASLKRSETTVHPANKPMNNKNPNNPKKTSVYPYEIIKNRRFTERQFEFHVPITLNYQAQGINAKEMNLAVRRALRECDDNYVIGIDRGERNLLYVCVIDSKGRIVEQFSLNSIISRNNDIPHETDYHALLSKKEEERDKSRKNWQSIEGIKELKEGYLSQVVHQICLLVEKYDAVIAMEDLNTGFKNSRSKVEKSVYQKFEKMLIDKLNFLADKHKNSDEVGGLLAAYQLTNKFESFAKMSRQNGFIFYVPAWLTSKIDPATGFADLLHPSQRINKEMAQDFIRRFNRISYEAGDFVFLLDYSKFPNGSTDHKKHWTLTTAGTRIKTFRDPKQNHSWVSEEVVLSPLFCELFVRYGISLTADDIREQICNQKDAGFYRELMGLIRLMLQMRNSKTGTDIDYLFSPAVDENGTHFDSRNYSGRYAPMPTDADGNGAYHIARKAQWAIRQLKAAESDQLDKVKLSISNKEWLEYVQSGENV